MPEQFGAWASRLDGAIIRPPEADETPIQYDEEISRVYARSDGSPPVMMVIAYGATQTDRLQLHRPEFCYPAGGFQISQRRSVIFAAPSGRLIPASYFTARRAQRVEQVFYWTRIGDLFPISWVGQHLARIRNSIGGTFVEGVLVRLSVLDGHPARSLGYLQGFATDLLRALPIEARQTLVGRDLKAASSASAPR